VPLSFELEEQGERGPPFRKQSIREWWQNPDRSRGLLLGYSLSFVLLGACTPAVFLSATNYTAGKTLSIGCRTLSWLVVSLLWISSAIADIPLSYLLRSKTLKLKLVWYWYLTIFKDSLIASAIIILVAFEQSGFYNNCWCLQASLTDDYIDLNSFTDYGWLYARIKWGSIAPCFFLLNLGLIAWVLLIGGESTGVVCKSADRLRRDGRALFGGRG
jgi:hypothetical protein